MLRIIVGLGNPGSQYKDTRHNLGFWVIDKLYEFKKVNSPTKNPRFQAEIFKIGETYLIKPLTFMNLAGNSVANFLSYFKIAPSELLVISDDIDQPLGQIRIRFGGSSGGHKGLQSIIEKIGAGFWRSRIGIGRSLEIAPEKYVLQKPKANEREELHWAVDKLAKELIELIDKNRNPGEQTFRETKN